MIKTIVGLILGLLIGIGCRCFDVPVPSPPKLLGALLVVAMTVGYMATDKFLLRSSRTGRRPQSDWHISRKILISPETRRWHTDSVKNVPVKMSGQVIPSEVCC